MATKYLDSSGLSYLWGKLKDLFDGKVDAVSGKGLSTEDYTTADKTKLAGVASGATAVIIDNTLATIGQAADAKATGDALAGKVDVVSGKGLSTEDYTTSEKAKLAGISAGATSVMIDDSLATTGQAADAKATGDAIADLQSQITALQSALDGMSILIYK